MIIYLSREVNGKIYFKPSTCIITSHYVFFQKILYVSDFLAIVITQTPVFSLFQKVCPGAILIIP